MKLVILSGLTKGISRDGLAWCGRNNGTLAFTDYDCIATSDCPVPRGFYEDKDRLWSVTGLSVKGTELEEY